MSSAAIIQTPSGAVVVNKIGHGLMSMTWQVVAPKSDEECFETIKAGVDSLPNGVKMFLNGGEFYGPENHMTANLDMLSRFFEKYPDYAEKTFLSVKGGAKANERTLDGSAANTTRSVNAVLERLRGKKKLDLFECARVDPKVPLEETIGVLAEFVKEGKIGSIGMSEVRAETLLHGHKIHPIAAVEIEVSPWEYGPEQQAVIKAAKENNIAVVAYSPIGRGFLSGEIKKFEDIPETDLRRYFPRFHPDNFDKNFDIVNKLSGIAKAKNVTPAQLSIAWVSSLGDHVIPIPGSSRKDRTLENLAGNNVKLTADELKQVNEVIDNATFVGNRYPGDQKAAFLWG